MRVGQSVVQNHESAITNGVRRAVKLQGKGFAEMVDVPRDQANPSAVSANQQEDLVYGFGELGLFGRQGAIAAGSATDIAEGPSVDSVGSKGGHSGHIQQPLLINASVFPFSDLRGPSTTRFPMNSGGVDNRSKGAGIAIEQSESGALLTVVESAAYVIEGSQADGRGDCEVAGCSPLEYEDSGSLGASKELPGTDGTRFGKSSDQTRLVVLGKDDGIDVVILHCDNMEDMRWGLRRVLRRVAEEYGLQLKSVNLSKKLSSGNSSTFRGGVYGR